MKRRSRVGGKPPKTRRRETVASKRGTASKAVPRASAAGLSNKLAQFKRERDDALEQQTATADVLKVISRSVFDLQAVLDTLVESAARLCHSDHAGLFRREGEFYRLAANFGFSKKELERIKQYFLTMVLSPGRGSIVGRTVLEAKPVQIADVLTDPEYTLPAEKIGNYRTALGIPLLREGVPIGVLVLMRSAPQSFTDKQIELLTTFADQAVIAIENVRLFEAEQQRTRELAESLAQQTATSEVLKVISSSPGDLKPVFNAMLENAARLCEAQFGNLLLCEGDGFRFAATHNVPPIYAELSQREPIIHPAPLAPLSRAVATGEFVHIVDLTEQPAYKQRDPPVTALVDVAGARTLLIVPMLKDGAVIGALGIFRQEVRLFTDKQIALVQNFAAQAVVAIENARLLNELRQRTDELGRSVGELRALGEVSQAVNSTLDLETVLSTIVAKAVQLSGTEAGAIYVFDDRQRELHLRPLTAWISC
jgi:GAF domain-containing protein